MLPHEAISRIEVMAHDHAYMGGHTLDECISHCRAFNSQSECTLDDATVIQAVLTGYRFAASATESDSANSANSANSDSVSHIHTSSAAFSSRSDVSSRVHEYIDMAVGEFSNVDIDRDLCLKTRDEKKARANALYYARARGRIKTNIKTGRHYKPDTSIAFVNWEEEEKAKAEYPIALPLGLSDLAVIAPRGVVLLEGSTNAGKTALCMDVLKNSLSLQPVAPLYLFSEGGPQEIKRRWCDSGWDFDLWRNGTIRSAPRTAYQQDVIREHNPDGLTVVDFISPLEGDYAKLGYQVDEIYSALNTGVAFCCIQKASGSSVGRGGEAIREKPRLSMTLDKLHSEERYVISRLKIAKCKVGRNGRNPENKSIVFGVHSGCILIPLTTWNYGNDDQFCKRMMESFVSIMDNKLGIE